MWSIDNSVELYGLPMAPPEDFGPFIAQRFQRAVLQRWKQSSESPPQPDDPVTQVQIGALFRDLVLEGLVE